MRTVLFILLMVPCLAVAGCSLTRGASTPEPFFYIVAADPQLYYQQEDDRNWRRTIAEVNRLDPDFLIVCGDLIQADNEVATWKKPGMMEHYDTLAKDYLRVAGELKPGIPIYNLAGNHDVAIQPTAETIAWYEERFGKAWYSFEHKHSFFLVLESNLLCKPEGAPGLAARQLDWLRETLENTRGKDYIHKTAYLHHPLCLKSVDEPDEYFNVPLARRRELLALLHEHGFRAVFSGHYHRNAHVRDGDLELITTSSCCVALGDDPPGVRIVRVYPDRLEHAYHTFEALPSREEIRATLSRPSR